MKYFSYRAKIPVFPVDVSSSSVLSAILSQLFQPHNYLHSVTCKILLQHWEQCLEINFTGSIAISVGRSVIKLGVM